MAMTGLGGLDCAPQPVQVKGALVREARGWLEECGFGDLTRGEIRRMPAADVIRGVERHYEGGWAQFIEDGQ